MPAEVPAILNLRTDLMSSVINIIFVVQVEYLFVGTLLSIVQKLNSSSKT